MSTLDQVRGGLQGAWGHVTDGWNNLRHLASNALTRFSPVRRGDVESVSDQIALSGSRWGLLTTEVQETDSDVIVRLEAPGMDAEDFDISVIDDFLLVRGEKRVESTREKGNFHIMECAYGRFERAIPLPTRVDDSKASARYKRGVLTLTLPKTAGSQRKQIKVQPR